MTKRILITGASGFVGSHFVDRALEEGYEVFAGVRSTSSKKYLQDARIKEFPIDSRQIGELEKALTLAGERFGGFHYIIHAAAVTKPRTYREFHLGNAQFTGDFAAMVLQTQPLLEKFVYISSISAQGPGPETMEPLSEDQPAKPFTPYGKSKLEGERAIAVLDNLPWITFRPAAIYGPRSDKFFLRILRMLQSGVAIKLGAKNKQQSFLYIEDLSDVVFRSLQSDIVQELFLVADGEVYNQDEFVELLAENMELSVISIRIPEAVGVGLAHCIHAYSVALRKPLHLSPYKIREVTAKNWHMDISKIKKQLGFEPKYPLPLGIAKSVEWWRSVYSEQKAMSNGQ